MQFGLEFGTLNHEVFVNCWAPPDINGDWVGYRFADTAYGAIEEEYTASGTFIYAFELNKTTGEARMILSDDDGTTPGYHEPNLNVILIRTNGFGNLELTWDETAEYYKDTDVALASTLHAYVVANPTKEVCYIDMAVPWMPIHYTFAIEDADFVADEDNRVWLVDDEGEQLVDDEGESLYYE